MSHTDMPIWLQESAAQGVIPRQAVEDARAKLEAALDSLRPLVSVGLIEVRGMVGHLERRLEDLDRRLDTIAA